MPTFNHTLSPPRCAPLALLLLAGCAALPDHAALHADRPAPIAAGQLASTQSLPSGSPSGNAAQWPGDGWWHGLGDAQLDALVAEGLASAPDLSAALARYRNASAMAQQAAGATMPTLDVKGGASLDKQSYNNGYPKAFVPQGWNDNGQLAASLGFDLDIWGRNRAALGAARADMRAAELDLRQARLLIASGIVSGYVDLARLLQEAAIRKAMLESRAAMQDLVGQRVANGLDARASLRQAEAGTATARADLAMAEEAVLLRRHQLAALIGAGPDRGLAIVAPSLPAMPEASQTDDGLPSGVTTDLLSRRPDIAAARSRVEASGDRVREAHAEFFPAINLRAMIGLQALGLNSLFASDSSIGSLGPAFTLPVFHGGAVRARYRSAQAGRDGAVADYNRTVLAAYQQVADAVTSRAALIRRLTETRAALAASQDAWSLTRQRYTGGLSSYLEVLSAEDRMLAARLAVNATDAAARSNDITLIRALGGGYAAPVADIAKDTKHD